MFHKTKRWLQPLKNESWYIIKHCARNAELYTKNINLQLDLDLKDEDGGDISSFIPNGEWDLIGKNKNIHTLYNHNFHFIFHRIIHRMTFMSFITSFLLGPIHLFVVSKYKKLSCRLIGDNGLVYLEC